MTFPDSPEAINARAMRQLEGGGAVARPQRMPCAPRGSVHERVLGDHGRELPLDTGFLLCPSLTDGQPPRSRRTPRIRPGAGGSSHRRQSARREIRRQQARHPAGHPPDQRTATPFGHLLGHLKALAIRSNAFPLRLDDFMHDPTDTQPAGKLRIPRLQQPVGSSGTAPLRCTQDRQRRTHPTQRWPPIRILTRAQAYPVCPAWAGAGWPGGMLIAAPATRLGRCRRRST